MMWNKLLRFIKYTIQILSLMVFVYLFSDLAYPLEPRVRLLPWFSYLDPWTLINYIRWQMLIPLWSWLPLAIIVITLLFGRVFCGWLCPFGALLMLTDKLSLLLLKIKFLKKVNKIRTGILRKFIGLRYFWLLFLFLVFLSGYGLLYSLTPFALFSHEIVRIYQREIPWVLISILLLTLLLSRYWCSVLCPTGLLLSLLGRFRRLNAISFRPGRKKNLLKSKITETLVTEEKNTLTRRQYLRLAGTVLAAGTLTFAVKRVHAVKKVLRPPGALDHTEFIAACNRCSRCIAVCPNKALIPMSILDGIESYGTPHIIARNASCSLCFSCQEVCPTGAITKVPLEQIHMGKAVINRSRCIAWNNSKLCYICGEQCPVVAIKGDEKYRPYVQLDQCVGCGSCERGCPVDGEAAIQIKPK